MLSQLILHLGGEIGAGIIHGEHNALDSEAAVEPFGAHFDAGQKIGDTLQRVVLALHGDQHAVRRDKGVDGQKLQ